MEKNQMSIEEILKMMEKGLREEPKPFSQLDSLWPQPPLQQQSRGWNIL